MGGAGVGGGSGMGDSGGAGILSSLPGPLSGGLAGLAGNVPLASLSECVYQSLLQCYVFEHELLWCN